MKRILIVLSLMIASPALADFVNGGFESEPDHFQGWTVEEGGGSGGVDIVASHGDWTAPSDGSYFALLNSDGANNQYLLSQPFTPSAESDIITFDYFWDDGPGNLVNAAGEILDSSGDVAAELINFSASPKHAADLDIPIAPNWATYSASISELELSSGLSYTIRFGIVNSTGNNGCFLGIDNVHLLDPPVHAPAPAACLLGIVGLGVAGIKLRKYC